MPILRLLIRIPTISPRSVDDAAQRVAVGDSLSTFFAWFCTITLPKAIKVNSAVLAHTSRRAVIRRTRSEPLARVLTYPHFGGPIPYAIDMSKRKKWTDYKYPLWVVHWLAVLARLVQARTAGRPAGSHCACDRVVCQDARKNILVILVYLCSRGAGLETTKIKLRQKTEKNFF